MARQRDYRAEYRSRIERLTDLGFDYRAARGHGGREVQIEGEKYSYRFDGPFTVAFVRQFEANPHSPPVPVPGTDRTIITVYFGPSDAKSYNLSNAQLRNLDRLAKGLDFDLKDTETP